MVAGVVRPGGVEYRSLTSNKPLLQEIARATNGRVLPFTVERAPDSSTQPISLFDREHVQPARARLYLWKWLMYAAIAMMMVDVGVRRIAWDRLISREFGARQRSRLRAAQPDTLLERVRARDAAGPLDRAFPAPAVLDDSDAEAIVIAQRERRERRSPPAVSPPQSSAPPKPVVEIETPQTEAPDDQGGLLAAKQRARRRFQEE